MKILLGSLPEAESLRKLLAEHLADSHIETVEICEIDPAALAKTAAEKMASEQITKAVFLGKTGIDVYARAGVYQNLAPVVCHDPLGADALRQNNQYRSLCMGSAVLKPKYAVSIMDVWLMTDRMEEDYKKE